MLNELDGIQLGPIFLSFQILSIIVSGAVAYFTFAYFVRRDFLEESSEILDKFQTSVIIFLVTYKIMPLFLEPSLLLTPGKLLIYSGGPNALLISAVISGGYLLYHFFSKKWSLKIIDYFAVASFAYLIVSHLVLKSYGTASFHKFGWLNNDIIFHPLNVYYVILYSLFLCSLMIIFKKQKDGVLAIFLLLSLFLAEALLGPFSV